MRGYDQNVSLIGEEFKVIESPDLQPGPTLGSAAYASVDFVEHVIWISTQTPRGLRQRVLDRALLVASSVALLPVLN